MLHQAFAVLALLGTVLALTARYFAPDQNLMRALTPSNWHDQVGAVMPPDAALVFTVTLLALEK